ncbi:MAG: thioesterase family protein [Paracoccaceae bacterium]
MSRLYIDRTRFTGLPVAIKYVLPYWYTYLQSEFHKKGAWEMRSSLKAGVSEVRKITVDKDRTIDFMGEDCRVYATPSLVHDIEHTCRDLVMKHADPGEDSVGTKISIAHTAPTPLGMEVRITATVAEVDRSRVVFEISASDALDEICTGRHERFVVDVEKTGLRLKAKAARAADQAT